MTGRVENGPRGSIVLPIRRHPPGRQEADSAQKKRAQTQRLSPGLGHTPSAYRSSLNRRLCRLLVTEVTRDGVQHVLTVPACPPSSGIRSAQLHVLVHQLLRDIQSGANFVDQIASACQLAVIEVELARGLAPLRSSSAELPDSRCPLPTDAWRPASLPASRVLRSSRSRELAGPVFSWSTVASIVL